MKIAELLYKYVNRENKERTIGRYYASEIFGVRKGYKTPDDFYKKNIVENYGNVLSGVAFEDIMVKVCNTMGVNCLCGDLQKKYEIKIDDDITIVCMPDFEFDDFVIETKFPVRCDDYTQIKDSYKDQLECEYRATKKQVYLGYFVHPFNLILLPYKQSDRRWGNIKKIIKKYHDDVVEIKHNIDGQNDGLFRGMLKEE